MKRITFVLLWMILGLPLYAQTTHRDSVLSRARYLKSIYRIDEAVDLMSPLVTPDSVDEGILSELADCHFQSGDMEGAAGTYFMLSARQPENILYQIRLMQIYYRLKAYPKSIQAGRTVLQRDSIPAVMSFIGDGFSQMGQADSALWYYRRSLALRPRNENTLSKAMGILLDGKDYDGAISLCEPFLARDPDNTVIAPLKGLALYLKKDYESSVKVFQRQEDIGNDSYPIHYYLGQSYWHTLVIYRAERELLAAWQIDSSDVNLAYAIAAVKAEAFRSFEKDVKPWLDKALDMLEPDHATLSRIHQQYGLGYYKRQDSWDQVISHYKEAYRYNPKFLPALSTIAYSYQQKKDYKHAVEWYEKYLKLAKPGSNGYEFAADNLAYVKSELFMEAGL